MKKTFYKLLILVVLISPFSVYAQDVSTEPSNTVDTNENVMIVTLEKCVDGDTATFKDTKGNTYKTRFLAIDTPETVHPTKKIEPYGKDASTYTCDFLTSAKEIKLETDPASDKEDVYGRLLAWVFVDGVLLQNSLIEKGLAEVDYLYGDYKYTKILQDTQEIAKQNKVGIWSEEEKVVTEKTPKDKSGTKEKNFIEEIVDSLLAKIFDYINELLDNIASCIENML